MGKRCALAHIKGRESQRSHLPLASTALSTPRAWIPDCGRECQKSGALASILYFYYY